MLGPETLHMDILDRLPYLARPDTWHADARPMIEEALQAPVGADDAAGPRSAH